MIFKVIYNSQTLNVYPELIKRYNLPGPRYTSYPTVPVWSEGDFFENYSNCLKEEGTSRNQISLYIHVPFCKQLCTYCGCNKYITNNQNLVENYLEALELEIFSVAERLSTKKELVEIHIGGGTPTVLNAKQIERLFNILSKYFKTKKVWKIINTMIIIFMSFLTFYVLMNIIDFYS